jgi:tetratricopeptide (TPR) repeat protein
VAAGVIVVAAWAVYHPTFSAPFVFDDQFGIVDNPSIRHLGMLGEVLRPPAYASGAAGRPLVNLSLALNYAFSGLDVWSYHVLNLALHILTALTLYGLIRRTLIRQSAAESIAQQSAEAKARSLTPELHFNLIALSATVIWALHPLLSESVTCVIQRNEVTAGLFYLLTLYCFERGTETGGGRFWLWAAVLSCALGMAAKEIMVSAPLAVLLYDRTFGSGTFRAAWRQHHGFYFALSTTWLLLAWLMVSSQHRGGTVGFGLGVSSWDYLLTQCRALTLYLKLSVWPHPLVIDYGTTLVRDVSKVAWEGIALVAMAAGTVAALLRRSAPAFIGAVFFAILAPTSSVVPLVTQPIAEHRMYLPLAAIVVLAVTGLYRLAGAKSLLVWPVLAVGLGALTARRNADYQNEVVLIQGSLTANPSNDRAYLNLGTLASRQGRTNEAIAYYETALRLAPEEADTHANLAAMLDQSGRRSDAINHYREAVRLQPTRPAPQLYLGLDLAKTGQLEEAIGPLEKALRLQPDSATARKSLALIQSQLGNIQAQAGHLPDAIAHYEAALLLEPNQPQTENNLANALSALGRSADSILHYESAVHLAPDYVEAHYNLAVELLQLRRLDEARLQFTEVLRLQPNDDDARSNVARIDLLLRK